MQVSNIPIASDLQEMTQRENKDFPLSVFHTVLNRNILGFVPWHWHNDIQFCLVTHGEVEFSINNKKAVCAEGCGIFVNSKILHRAKAPGIPDSSYICVNADTKLLESFPGSAIQQRFVFPYLNYDFAFKVIDKDDELSAGLKQRILDISELHDGKDPQRELLLLIKLYECWSILLREFGLRDQTSRVSNKERQVVCDIIRHLEENYAREITLDDIEDKIHLNKDHCCRIFKRITGTSIFSYLRELRITRSIELLRGTKKSIEDIAYVTGFCSASHYISNFKALTGTTPLQYRKH